jgi:hypothetical protein
MAVENRLTGARRQRLTATSISRMCPRVLSRYVLIGLHVDFIDCKTALAGRRGCSTSRDTCDRSRKPRATERTSSLQPRDAVTTLLTRDDDHVSRWRGCGRWERCCWSGTTQGQNLTSL